jgi:hypothetical protein
MFRKKSSQELEPPPIAKNIQAVEALRVWAMRGQTQQVTLKTTWKSPAAWGLMLADVARHAANAYANEGHNREEVLALILQMLDAEMTNPTDEAKDIS